MPGVECREQTFYKQAHAIWLDGRKPRVYQIGDCVMLRAKKVSVSDAAAAVSSSGGVGEDEDAREGEECSEVIVVGQILQFMRQHGEDATSAGGTSNATMRLFYRPENVTDEEREKCGMGPALPEEHYLSDQVETIPIESVIGLARLRQSKVERDECIFNPPGNFRKTTDNGFVCRSFYASSDPDEAPKRMRNLLVDELAYLLQNPTLQALFDEGEDFIMRCPPLRTDGDNKPIMFKYHPVRPDSERIRKRMCPRQGRKVFRCRCCYGGWTNPPAVEGAQMAAPFPQQTRKRGRGGASAIVRKRRRVETLEDTGHCPNAHPAVVVAVMEEKAALDRGVVISREIVVEEEVQVADL